MVTEEALAGRAAGSYAALFERYLANGIVAALARVRGGHSGMSEDDRQQAWHLLSYALQMPSLWPDTRDLLLALAPKMLMAGFRHDWIPYLEKGLTVSGVVSDVAAQAALHIEMGELHRYLGQYGNAERHFGAALALAQQAGDRTGEAAALVCASNLAHLTQRLEMALRLADATLAIVAPSDPQGARALFVKGCVCDARNQWEAAAACFRQAQAIWALANDRRWVALCQQNLAGLALATDQYDEAIEAYNQAIELLDEVNDQASLALAKMNLGIVYYLVGDPAHALALYHTAEITYRRFLDLRSQAMVYNNLALAYRALGNWSDAEEYFAQSIHMWNQLGDQKRRINAEDGLGKLHLGTGRIVEAQRCFQRLLAELEETDHDGEYERLRGDILAHLAQAGTSSHGNEGR